MAFYGRVTNESKTSMTFDKVYPNREAMKAGANSDGVFVGRFVLIEYGNDEAYSINYNIDNEASDTPIGKGYDSTVWRKIIKQNGDADYVMLAELNSVVPTFNVEPAPPSEGGSSDPNYTLPTQPYFSKDSTNVLYNLHVGVPWGFKTNKLFINEAGFIEGTHSTELEAGTDEIKIEPKQSGQTYKLRNSSTVTTATDQQELTISLPTLGIIADKSWNLIYGVKEDNSRDTGKIGWQINEPNPHNSTSLVNDKKIESIAGAINSACDLIGTMVYSAPTNSSDASEMGIYYNNTDGKFYFKDYLYTVSALDTTTQSEIIQMGSDYIQFNGELKNPSTIGYPLYTKPTVNDDYYALPSVTNDEVKPGGMYYDLNHDDLDILNNIENADQDSSESFEYLKDNDLIKKIIIGGNDLTLQPLDVNDNRNGTYYKYNISSPEHKIYFPASRSQISLFNEDNTRITTASDLNSKKIIYKLVREEQHSHPIDEHGDIIEDQIIYTHVLERAGVTESLAADAAKLEELNVSYDWAQSHIIHPWPNSTSSYTVSNGDVTYINNQALWIKDGENYKLIPNSSQLPFTDTESCLNGIDVYTISLTRSVNPYRPNAEYWGTIPETGRVYRKMTPENDGLPTYKLTNSINASTTPPTPVSIELSHYAGVNGLDDVLTGTFYFVPNELYVKNGNSFEKASEYDLTTAQNHGYYKYREVVVKSDPLGEFIEGERWNTLLDINEINGRPERADQDNKLILGLKIATPHLFELEGYSKNTNTLNGWILHLNKLVGSAGDSGTRNSNTIQGLINTVNDKIGRIDDTQKDKLIISDKNAHFTAATITNDAWTGLTVSDSIVTINHNKVWTNSSNIPTFGIDNGNFIFPVVDAAGHITGTTQVTASEAAGAVQMPSTIQTLNIGEASTATSALTTASGSISADSSADTININAANKWISLAANNKSLQIGHLVQTINTATASSTVTNGTMNLQTVAYDAAGHITDSTVTAYTLPFGFKTINGVTASNAEDDFTVTISTDAWLSTSTSTSNNNSTITISHADASTVTHTNVANVSLTFGGSFTISDLDFDGKGHFAGSGTHSVILPTVSVTTATSTENGSSIVRGISFDSSTSTATLTQTVTDVDELILTNYYDVITPQTPLTTSQIGLLQSPVAATDPIHQAFEKLQYQSSITASNIADLQNTAALIGESTDAASVMTLYGVKAYVDRDLGIVQTESNGQTVTTTITLSNLMDYIASLEARIVALETTTSGGNTPEPEPGEGE